MNAIPNDRLPQTVREQLSTCPQSGGGIHRWLFRTALTLHRRHVEPSVIVRCLTDASAGHGRHVPRHEIEDAVRNSARHKCNGAGRAAVPTWPAINEGCRAAIIKSGPSLEEFKASSPVPLWDGVRTEDVIDILFPGNPLLCAGLSQHVVNTQPREQWRKLLSRCQFIVPSPMSAAYGVTQDGRQSKRTLDNTGPRRFLVVEFDSGSFDEHARLLLHLAQFGRLTLTVHSGGKSLHGWFFCQAIEEGTLRRFMRYAVSIGADPATWTRCQLVRMPDGRRGNGNRQPVVYFNPKAMEAK